MTNTKKTFAFLFCLLSTLPSAHAGVGLLAGAGFHSVSTDDNGTNQNSNRDSKLGFIGGLSFSSNFMLLNAEIDALYDKRTLNVAGFSASSPAIQVPLLVRFSLLPAILDAGVGPYASFNVGSNDLGYQSPDFGAVGSLRITVPAPIRIVLDGRYNWGFKDLSKTPLLSLHTREWQIMAGIDIPISSESNQAK